MVNEVGSVTSLPVASFQSKAFDYAPVSVNGKGRVLHLPANQAGKAEKFSSLAKISELVDRNEAAAVDVRQAQKVLGKAGDVLEKAESNLLAIVKQYPPYGLESTERIQYLNAITGLRKQLDALSFPAEKMGATDASFPLPQFPKSGDLSIPELDPKKATDKQIASALDAVQNAQKRVADNQRAMWEDVSRFSGTQDEEKAKLNLQAVQSFVAKHQDQGIGVSVRDILASGV